MMTQAKLRMAISGALLAGLAVSAGPVHAQGVTYTIDPMHTEADFAVRHMAVSTVHGHFGNVSGTVIYDPSDVTKSSVTATIDTTTLDTGVGARDKDVKSPEFLDVVKFPTMTFKSDSVKADGDGFDVNGQLTLHGVTRPVVLKVEPSKEQVGMDGKTLARGFEATTTINRKDFGLVWNGMLKSGDAIVSDEIKIDLSVEGDRK